MKIALLTTAALGASAAVISNPAQPRDAKHQFVGAANAVVTERNVGRRIRRALSSRAGDSVLGGVVASSPGILSATGTFVVPEARPATKGPTANLPTTYAASLWVGIDGVSSCTTASLRGGVDVFWNPEGATYNAWYQWAPDRTVDFVVPVSPGDNVRVTTTTGAEGTSGAVTIENLTTGQTASRQFDSSGTPAPLCRTEASWAIFDPIVNQGPGLPAPLANFTAVTFAEAGATAAGSAGGAPLPVSLDTEATVLNINQPAQGGQLTDCSKTANSVTCARVVGGAAI